GRGRTYRIRAVERLGRRVREVRRSTVRVGVVPEQLDLRAHTVQRRRKRVPVGTRIADADAGVVVSRCDSETAGLDNRLGEREIPAYALRSALYEIEMCEIVDRRPRRKPCRRARRSVPIRQLASRQPGVTHDGHSTPLVEQSLFLTRSER